MGNNIEDKLNLESEHALLLEEAYQLGYHQVRNGCLIPLTEKLDAIITTETTNAREDERKKIAAQVRAMASDPKLQKLFGDLGSAE